jgi:diaminohydroxyphosphoribosylaminopyrimidine deaminase/5-amino-6-(5-phosphoribosylamino)uracil reductase
MRRDSLFYCVDAFLRTSRTPVAHLFIDVCDFGEVNMNATAAMQRAIELSKLGLGRTGSNPIVGAVIFNADGIIAEGFHQSGPHAEVVAINNAINAGKDLSGSSIAVTLEPCNHHGKTPPCTDAIINAGIKEVIYAVTDPNHLAAGGAAALGNAGITVQSGILKSEAAFANRGWLNFIKNNRPYFTWKIATTLDGKIAASDGSSKWISNEASRNYVAQLRNQSDAILVGTGTVIADNPNLVSENKALRVAVGNRDIAANLNIKDDRAPFYHHQDQDLSSLSANLLNRGIVNVLVEAGPTLGTALIKAGLIDEIAIFTAPKLLGAGASFINDLGISNISDALELELIESANFEGDLFSRYRVVK